MSELALQEEASNLADEFARHKEAEERKEKTKKMGFMYGVVSEASAVRKLKMKMKAEYYLPPAGPTKWFPPKDEICRNAVGDIEQLTSRMKEVYNADSPMFIWDLCRSNQSQMLFSFLLFRYYCYSLLYQSFLSS